MAGSVVLTFQVSGDILNILKYFTLKSRSIMLCLQFEKFVLNLKLMFVGGNVLQTSNIRLILLLPFKGTC